MGLFSTKTDVPVTVETLLQPADNVGNRATNKLLCRSSPPAPAPAAS